MLCKSQLKQVGISDPHALVTAQVNHRGKKWKRLKNFFRNPSTAKRRRNLTFGEACAQNYVIDVDNSLDWMHLPSCSGCAPTVTSTHNKDSIVVLKNPIDEIRFMLPEEHFLLQGFDLKHIKAISAAVGGSPSSVGHLAGNAIPLPVMGCFVRTLSATYPEVFKQREL